MLNNHFTYGNYAEMRISIKKNQYQLHVSGNDTHSLL